MSLSHRIAWNRAKHDDASVRRLQAALGLGVDGDWGIKTQRAADEWQLAQGLRPDGKIGTRSLAAIESGASPPEDDWRALTDEEVDAIIEQTIKIESAGAKNPYAAANRNAEYEGWFDKPKRHPETNAKLKPSERAKLPSHNPHSASKYGPTPTMIGLSHGPNQTTQDGGSLGTAVKNWYVDEPDRVDACFMDRGAALVELLTRPGKSGFSQGILRGPRVQPLDGHDLWSSYWMPSWNAAAEEPGYQRAQRKVAREGYFEPAIEICKEYLFSSQVALAVAYDCCIQYGRGGARKRFRKAGVDASLIDVLDVLEEMGDSRARSRREEIVEHLAPWIHYEDLVFQGPMQ